MKPFFSFFGSKYRLARSLYPKPEHDMIIEPFAGSACYSLVHNTRSVTINDIDPVIVGVWDFLIGSSADCIRSLPLLEAGQSVDDLSVCQEAKWFIGFWLNKGTSRPCKTMSAWAPKYPKQFWGEHKRSMVASQVHLINHWVTSNKQYYDLPNETACWFVDPPYQEAGTNYKHGSSGIDYKALGAWCANRSGQIIVCENQGADWLPFAGPETLKNTRNKMTSEVAYVASGGQPNLFGAQ